MIVYKVLYYFPLVRDAVSYHDVADAHVFKVILFAYFEDAFAYQVIPFRPVDEEGVAQILGVVLYLVDGYGRVLRFQVVADVSSMKM